MVSFAVLALVLWFYTGRWPMTADPCARETSGWSAACGLFMLPLILSFILYFSGWRPSVNQSTGN